MEVRRVGAGERSSLVVVRDEGESKEERRSDELFSKCTKSTKFSKVVDFD